MADRPPIRAHASVGASPGSTAGVYAQQGRLNAMHGRRIPVDPPRPVLVHLLWGDKTPGLLHAWVFDRQRGWLAEVSATIAANDVELDGRAERAAARKPPLAR